MATAFLRRFFAGGGTSTNLANSMASTDITFTINSATGWPGASGFFTVVIDRGTATEEKIRCASNSGTTVTVATDGNGGRGYDGSSAFAHNANATVSLCGGAIDFNEANEITNFMGNLAAGAIPYGAGTGTLPTDVTIGENGTVLTSNGSAPGWALPSVFTPYQTQILAAPAASVSFTVPGGARNLRLKYQVSSADATTLDALAITFNSDTSSHYDQTKVEGTGSAASSTSFTEASIQANSSLIVPGTTNSATGAATGELQVDNYIGTTFFKGYRLTHGYSFETVANSANVSITGQWRSTAAVTTITFTLLSGDNFVIGSAFDLYME